MDPAARGFETMEVTECSEAEYRNSLKMLCEADAIMDESIEKHVRKVVSHEYSVMQCGPSKMYNPVRLANREAVNRLISSYRGYAWLSQVLDAWISKVDGMLGLEESSPIHNVLAKMIEIHFSPEKALELVSVNSYESWRPPYFYRGLMHNDALCNAMQKLYAIHRNSEFLASWNQDFMASRIDTVEKSKSSSNFIMFIWGMCESFRQYLLIDYRTELMGYSPKLNQICDFFCHAENAYFYSQALLSFIIRWRPDLEPLRRLSQTIFQHVSTQQSAAPQLSLIMTNVKNYSKLSDILSNIFQQGHQVPILIPSEVSKLYEAIEEILKVFDMRQTLLYEKSPPSRYNIPLNPSEHTNNNSSNNNDDNNSDTNGEATPYFNLPSASAYGGSKSWKSAYVRVKHAPEFLPIQALRTTSLIDSLLQQYVNPDIDIKASFVTYAKLIVLLTVASPYELLTEEELSQQRAKLLRSQHPPDLWGSLSDLSEESCGSESDESLNENSLLSFDSEESGVWERESLSEEGKSSPSSSSAPSYSEKVCSGNYKSIFDPGRRQIGRGDGKSSLIQSSIYKNKIHKQKLGVSSHISEAKLKSITQKFQTYKQAYDELKNIAMSELFEIYNVTHQLNLPFELKIATLCQLQKTNIASSAILAFVKQSISSAPDSLIACSDTVLTLLKEMVDRHKAKRIPVFLTLKGCFDSTGTSSLEEGNMRKRAILQFGLYLIGVGECVSVLTALRTSMQRSDRSLVRWFLLSLWDFCAPPYSSDFCRPVLLLLSDFFSSTIDGVEEALYVGVETFLCEAELCDTPNEAPKDIASLLLEMKEKVNKVKKSERFLCE